MNHQTPTALRQWVAALFVCTLFVACTKPREEKENQPPGAFTVSVSNVTFKSATLTWTAAADPDNEAVTYSVELNGQSSTTGLSATTHSLSNLMKNTAYTGKVTARDASGKTTTADFAFSTTDTPAPSDFTLRLGDSTNKSLTVSWTASTLPNGEAVKYDVLVGTTLRTTDLTVTQYQVTGLTPNTAYQVKVVAKSAGGKSTEKTLNAQTAANIAPTALSAQSSAHGFSYATITWTAATDANGDSLSYFLDRGNMVLPLTTSPVNGTYTYVAKQLSSATAYNFKIIARDGLGGEVASNDVAVTTNAAPENNFRFQIRNSGSDVEVEWIQNYPVQFQPGASSYFINNVEKSMAGVQVNQLDLGGGKIYTKVFLNGADFPMNELKPVKVKLNWGSNEYTTQSRTFTHARYTFSPTSAEILSAILKRNSDGSYSFVLKFKNDVISDYDDWDVQDFKIDNSVQPGVGIQFRSGKTVQSVFGNLMEVDYDYLQTKSDGYIIVKDTGGYHRLNFTYTVQ